jgi:MarR family transcriptional regulator, 2-MHQ and catechol-resistance regulon repressor
VGKDRREAFYRERVRSCALRDPAFDPLSVETTLGILHTYDLFHQIMSRNLAEYGLSKSTWNILMLLKHGEAHGMLLRDLGELLLVSKANITGLIDHLEQKGYVTRVVDSHDRRARFARLTRAGEELLERYAPIHYRSIAELLKDLTTEEKETLISLLQKTRGSLAAHATAASFQADPQYQVAEG